MLCNPASVQTDLAKDGFVEEEAPLWAVGWVLLLFIKDQQYFYLVMKVSDLIYHQFAVITATGQLCSYYQ